MLSIFKEPSEAFGNDFHTIKIEYLNLGQITDKLFFEAVRELDNEELNNYLKTDIHVSDDVLFIFNTNLSSSDELFFTANDLFNNLLTL